MREARRFAGTCLGGLAPLAGIVGVALASPACGYRAEYAGVGERFHVEVVRMLVPDPVACAEVASGVREELARGGLVEAGDGYPRVEIEVLRGGEAADGALGAIGIGVAGQSGTPKARALGVGITARAWIARAPGAAPERDTGDIRAEETVPVGAEVGGQSGLASEDLRGQLFHLPDAQRAAARRLGHRLAERILGLPAASE